MKRMSRRKNNLFKTSVGLVTFAVVSILALRSTADAVEWKTFQTKQDGITYTYTGTENGTQAHWIDFDLHGSTTLKIPTRLDGRRAYFDLIYDSDRRHHTAEDNDEVSRKFHHVRHYKLSEVSPYYNTMDGILYDRDIFTLIAYPADRSDTTFTVPDGKGICPGGGNPDSAADRGDL